jgi:hypothetical protein
MPDSEQPDEPTEARLILPAEHMAGVWATTPASATPACSSSATTLGLFLATAGAVVQLALVCRLAALRARRRELCLELIIGGSQGMPLACLERESRRLLEPRTLERLATRRATDCRSGPGTSSD